MDAVRSDELIKNTNQESITKIQKILLLSKLYKFRIRYIG